MARTKKNRSYKISRKKVKRNIRRASKKRGKRNTRKRIKRYQRGGSSRPRSVRVTRFRRIRRRTSSQSPGYLKATWFVAKEASKEVIHIPGRLLKKLVNKVKSSRSASRPGLSLDDISQGTSMLVVPKLSVQVKNIAAS